MTATDGPTAIWLLSTRGRPKECQQTIDACQASGMTSPGVVYVDETVDEYRNLRLPPNWRIHCEPEWGSLQASLTWCFNEYPDAARYGWLADDVRPRTRGWDVRLEDAAGDWGLSYARDLWFSEVPDERDRLAAGGNLSSGLCWGGDLIRTVGWWALPGVRQAWIDVAWVNIVGPLGLARYRHDIVVEHLNYRTGKRPKDAVDDWERNGDGYIERDIEFGQEWYRSADYRATLERVARAAGCVQGDDALWRYAHALRDSVSNGMWRLPGARLIKYLTEYDEGVDLDQLATLLNPHADQGPS